MNGNDCKKLDSFEVKRLAEKLISKCFDGIVLIEAETGSIAETNKISLPCLPESVLHGVTLCRKNYHDIAERFALQYAELSGKTGLDTVKEELCKNDIYTLKFGKNTNGNLLCADRKIEYTYLDDAKRIIVMTLEDIPVSYTDEKDSLTGLYNSTGFHKRVRKWIEENPGKKYRMQRYDIDRFKDINGVYGYELGNELLYDMGKYMKRYDSENSFSAHLNGDHFARFCSEDFMSAHECYNTFKECFSNYNLKLPISIHIGVYDLCEPDCDSYMMSYKALLALQSVKGNFTRHIQYYESGMMGLEIEYQELLKDVEKALNNEEFEVWFQPQVDYTTNKILCAEALVRWRHPKKGLLAPDRFIPILERSEHINLLDIYVITKTCEYIKKWSEKMPNITVRASVNLSRKDIYCTDVCEKLESMVKESGISMSQLRIEITESAYMVNPEKLAVNVNKLRKCGFIIEMDDFGVGYSSLNTLKDIDIDILKLDMKFVSDSQDNKKSKIILSSVIKMASELNIPLVAEGVETKKQADMLLSYGCRYMQGYYFSKPVPAEEYEKMLEAMNDSI